MAILLCGIVDGVIEGIKEGTVAIVEKDITAIGYRIENPASLEDPEELSKSVEIFRHINSCYFLDYTLVPLRFGNIVEDEDDLKAFLNKTYIQLKSLFKKNNGMVEFVIQIKFDLEVAKEDITKRVDMSDIVAVGKALFELAESRKVEVYTALKNMLSPLVVDYLETGSTNEIQLINNSYLVEKEKENLFEEAVDRVAEASDDCLLFQYIGPMPTYSFVPLGFTKGCFELINGARLLLGLGEKATFDEAKKSYRKLSLEFHPDKNPTGEETFKKINEAYRVITAYNTTQKNEESSFTKEAIENSFAAV
jgi:hypothetical protein